jgi:hypothetical protein
VRREEVIMLLSIRTCVLAAIAALSFFAGPARAQYDMCGTLEQGVTCPVLFRDDQNALWLLQTHGTFQIGDRVHVTGVANPGCITFCQQGNGCINNNTIGPCDPTTGFCFCASGAPCGNVDASAGCRNSTGVGALLGGSGSASVAADDLVLNSSRLPHNVSAIVFMGASPISITFGDGLRCVGASFVGLLRFPLRNAGTAGSFDEGPIVGYANTHFPLGAHIAAGSTWLFQSWYRDPSGPCGQFTNLSNAVSVTFTP